MRSERIRISLAVLFVACLAGGFANAGETIHDTKVGFDLTLPNGFVANPNLATAAPNILYGFVCGDPNDDQLDLILFVEDLGKPFKQELLTEKKMPPGIQATHFTTTWQGLLVDAFAVPEMLGETKTITFNVQIPLKKAGIQIKLFGPADRETELRELLATILSNLHGETNWTTQPAAAGDRTGIDNYGYVLLGIAIGAILVGLVILMVISRFAPRGTVLAIACVCYAASLGIPNVRSREVQMLTGAMRMFGFAGGILGIVDLIRRRKDGDKGKGAVQATVAD